MTVWLKLTLAILAGSAGLLVMLLNNQENEAVLEETVRRELEGLRDHLFDR